MWGEIGQSPPAFASGDCIRLRLERGFFDERDPRRTNTRAARQPIHFMTVLCGTPKYSVRAGTVTNASACVCRSAMRRNQRRVPVGAFHASALCWCPRFWLTVLLDPPNTIAHPSVHGVTFGIGSTAGG
jgi:hypothetical protein